jgi:hypothetical protein
MAFDNYAPAPSTDKPAVDYDALNRYVVEECKLQQPETMLGVISMIVDLGTQKQNDATYKLEGDDVGLTAEQLTVKYAKEIAEGKISKFADAYDSDSSSWLLQKFVPQKPHQSIAYAVDFPDIMLDKGKFFGEDNPNPKPLRMWIGGQYWNKHIGEKGKMLVQNVIPLKVTKDDKITGWTMNPLSSMYKMALAAKLIQTDEAFLPENIDALLGKTLQFKAQIFFKKGKDGKEYYTEKLAYAAGMARGQAERQLDATYLIQFKQDNDPQGLKELRGHIVNTIQNATNYEGSAIQKQFEALKGGQAQPAAAQAAPAATKPVAPTAPADLDDDMPF